MLIQNDVTIPNNYIVSYETRIDNEGVLNLGTTFGHRLGNVSGTGKLYIERGELPVQISMDLSCTIVEPLTYGGATELRYLK